MSLLKIVQTTDSGRSKVWKLNSTTKTLTFGTSKKAQLISIDNTNAAFESVIEYRNNNWHCISFNINESSSDSIIQNQFNLKLSNSNLQFEIINKNINLLNSLCTNEFNGSQKKRLILKYKNDQLLDLNILNVNDTYAKFYSHSSELLKFDNNEDWQTLSINDVIIKTKIINTNDTLIYNNPLNSEIIDNESKKPLIISLAVVSLLVFMAFLSPIQNSTPKLIKTVSLSSQITLPDLKKNKKSIVASSQTKPLQTSSSSAGEKTKALLRAGIGSRISQLLSKVSSSEARSTQVIIATNAIRAGEAPSGRALAAIGKIESSGRNWNGESSGKNSGVSTNGIGGGKGSSLLGGGLSVGKTGSGGVGLIEDESEIIGGLDREVIAQYIKTQLGQILYCYERQLSASPNLYGKIAVKFTIAGTGLVETQTINDTTLKNNSVENCILNKVSKWKFPEPKGGTKVLVTYPFLFKSTI